MGKSIFMIQSLVIGKFNGSLNKSNFVFLYRIIALGKKNGLGYTARYLKACHVITVRFISGYTADLSSGTFDPRVSLTRGGLPRIIPSYLRQRLYEGDVWSIRWILTIFNLYRVLPYPGVLKLNTITDPSNEDISIKSIEFVSVFIKDRLRLPPFEFKFRPFAIKSKGSLTDSGGNSVSGLLLSLIALRFNPSLWDSFKWFFISPLPKAQFERQVFRYIDLLSNLLPTQRTKGEDPSKYSMVPFKTDLYYLGRLAYKEEPGKVRVFAMVDVWTQWVLNSLHEYIFNILKHIPNDGTFNQDQAVVLLQTLLKNAKCAFSYDLSAATDRLPISIQIKILNEIGADLGYHWANLLVNRDYSVRPHKSVKSLPESVRYATGQPMGALSSWAMLALTHHYIVQLAANNVGIKGWFSQYVLLGDDIVITNILVAKEYYRLMVLEFGVDINLAKSIKSTKRVAEFAKRIVTPTDDLSGLSLKEFATLYLGWSSVIALIKKLNPSEYNFNKFIGRGSISSGNAPRQSKILSKRFIDWALYQIATNATELFNSPKIIGGLNYYVTGAVIQYKAQLISRLTDWGYYLKTVLKPIYASTPDQKILGYSHVPTWFRSTLSDGMFSTKLWTFVKASSLLLPNEKRRFGLPGMPIDPISLSSLEYSQLRLFSLWVIRRIVPYHTWPDDIRPGYEERLKWVRNPTSKFPFGKFETVWIPITGLFDARLYTSFLSRLDGILWSIFKGSPFWEELVWGRRPGFMKEVPTRLAMFSNTEVRWADSISKIMLWFDKPLNWFSLSDPNKHCPNSIDHIFKTTSSEKKWYLINSDLDVSKWLYAYLLISRDIKNANINRSLTYNRKELWDEIRRRTHKSS